MDTNEHEWRSLGQARTYLSACLLAVCFSMRAEFVITEAGKAACVIVQQDGTTEAERSAVRELTNTLSLITRAEFAVSKSEEKAGHPVIIVGPGAVAAKYFPEADLTKLEGEECLVRVKDGKLLLAGGRPRGTIYAVNRFLQEQCGVRWWTPWASNIPHQATLKVANLDVHEKPAFEYRGPYWFPGFEPHWKAHNAANNETWEVPKELGGCIKYKGFCHTFYPLVPPEKYFAEHPEWYSLIKGKRTHDRAQLCLTNPKLRHFVAGQVKAWLRESPDAQIISVTQNDWAGWCECDNCKALDDAEGSHAGTMLAFANYVAEKIEPEFPNVAVDTFAYQYTRKPPKTLRPRPNVIVRLCSIECNFREPLDHPSNAEFLADLEGWSKICSRLYVWDYTTDFKNYIHPHPNWFTLGPNVRLFQKYGVKGLFEQGAYAGQGAESAELRAWLLSQLMWNPKQDDRALIREFLDGYYGREAAGPIYKYLELMYRASEGVILGCFLRKEQSPHLEFAALGAAERLWQEAERVATGERLTRVRIAHLPVRCAFLKYWARLRHDCWEQNQNWPLPESRKAVSEEFRAVCQGVPGQEWTQVRVMSEHGLTVEEFLKGFADDPPEKFGTPPPIRLKNPPPPKDLPVLNPEECVDLQDNVAALYLPGKFADIHPDEAASDKRAVWMPGTHEEWAFRIGGSKLPAKALRGEWKVYAVVRVKKLPECKADSIVFRAGVYDNKEKIHPAGIEARAADAGDGYRSYLLGTVAFNADRDIWVAPAKNTGVKAVWVDRIYIVPAL